MHNNDGISKTGHSTLMNMRNNDDISKRGHSTLMNRRNNDGISKRGHSTLMNMCNNDGISKRGHPHQSIIPNDVICKGAPNQTQHCNMPNSTVTHEAIQTNQHRLQLLNHSTTYICRHRYKYKSY